MTSMMDCNDRYDYEIEGYFENIQKEAPKTAEDVWQAAADYCVMFFNSNVIYEHKQLNAMVTLVGILLRGCVDEREGCL